MRQNRVLWLVAVLVLCSIVLPGSGKQTPPSQREEQDAAPLIGSVKGAALFRAYCASCHGLDARGGGPAAAALTAKVPDLTLLAKNNGGRFPAQHVREIVAGDKVAAHGSREMPIWGPIFHQVEADMDWGNVRLSNLVSYLQSLQSSTAPSGPELYQQHCAVCHGVDLKGSGPAPKPYRTPPDLTTLAARHGGKFPGTYVSRVLRNGVVVPAHGPAEMPVWGEEFATARLGEPQVALRIANLTDYIKSAQAK